MAEDWNAIAEEVAEAIRSVSDTSQPGGYPAVLRRAGPVTGDEWNPTPSAPTYLTIHVIEDSREMRDANGTLIGQTVRTLTTTAVPGIVPSDDDTIAVGVSDGASATEWLEIAAVRPLAPAGVAVLYEIDLVS